MLLTFQLKKAIEKASLGFVRALEAFAQLSEST